MSFSGNQTCPDSLSTWRNIQLCRFTFSSWVLSRRHTRCPPWRSTEARVRGNFLLSPPRPSHWSRTSQEWWESIGDNKHLCRPACNISLFECLISFTDSLLLTYFKHPYWFFRLEVKQLPSNTLFVVRGNHGRFHSDTPMMSVIIRVIEILKEVDISKTLWMGNTSVRSRL